MPNDETREFTVGVKLAEAIAAGSQRRLEVDRMPDGRVFLACDDSNWAIEVTELGRMALEAVKP
jgi:hypothetical protein